MNIKPVLGRFTLFCAALFCAGLAHAEIFIFSAQPDPPPSGPVNFSWFSANNWFTNDPVTQSLKHANTLPAPGDTAQIGGGVNAAGNTIHLDTLILTANAAVSGGDFIVSKVQMHGGSGGGTTKFTSSFIEVITEMDVFGGSCGLESSKLSIDIGATCFLGLGGTGALSYSLSQVINDGEIVLYPNSSSTLSGGTNLINFGGATILGGSNTVLTAANFDNSGRIQCDSGTFSVSSTTWSSTSGLGKFKTTASNAVIAITSTLTVPPGVTNIVSGPGLTTLANGANVRGTLLVGVYDPSSFIFDPGTLQFANQVGGTGTVEVVALPGNPSVLMVNPAVNGSITGAVVNVDAGGQFNISYSGNAFSLTLNGVTINNSGTTTLGGRGGVAMIGNAVFNNMPGGIFDSQIQNPSIDGTVGSGGAPAGGAINNAGTFRKSAGTNALQLAADFNNSGLLDLQTGQVQIYGGTSSGTFSAAPGTEVRFGSGARTNILNPGTQLTGTNFFRLNQGSAVVLNGNVTVPNFSIEAGYFDGPGTLTVTNILNWSGNANLQGVGAINIPAGATFNVTSGGRLLQRTINNAGNSIMTNAFPGVDTNAVFNNLAGGLLELRTGGGFGFVNPPPVPRPVLTNFGLIRCVGNSTEPISFDIYNRGTVLILSNQLNCYAYQQLGGTTTIASNTVLNPTSMNLQGGTLNGSGKVQGNSISGLINSGLVSPGNSPGILSVSGGVYTQTVAGALSILIAGTNVGSQYSRLNVDSAQLNGTLSVVITNGFHPSLGDTYSVVATTFYGAVTGTFSGSDGLHVGNGIVLVPVYGGYGVNLVAATDPVLTASNRIGNQFTFGFPSTIGLTNIVEYTDLLNPQVWKPLATNVGDGTVKIGIDPFATNATRFYRVRFK